MIAQLLSRLGLLFSRKKMVTFFRGELVLKVIFQPGWQSDFLLEWKITFFSKKRARKTSSRPK